MSRIFNFYLETNQVSIRIDLLAKNWLTILSIVEVINISHSSYASMIQRVLYLYDSINSHNALLCLSAWRVCRFKSFCIPAFLVSLEIWVWVNHEAFVLYSYLSLHGSNIYQKYYIDFCLNKRF